MNINDIPVGYDFTCELYPNHKLTKLDDNTIYSHTFKQVVKIPPSEVSSNYVIWGSRDHLLAIEKVRAELYDLLTTARNEYHEH